MRVIYVCGFTGLCGGTKVIASHVAGLAARGHSAEWWGLDVPPAWFRGGVPYRRFAGTDALGTAIQAEHHAAVVATWWQTASWVAPNLRHSSRGFYLVQDIDQSVYSGDHSGSSYKLGLAAVTESEFITREVRTFGIEPANVGIGVDLEAFRPLTVPRDPDRVFAAYRPLSGPNDLKGWATTLKTIQLVRQGNPAASLVTFGNQGSPKLPPDVPHIHVNGPSDEKLRELYSQAGCYLMASRREGFCLPAAEAMACGAAVVCTDAGGNMEFCRHGETALVGYSAEELARHVLALRGDPGRRDRLAAAGRNFVAARYQWSAVIGRLEALYAPAAALTRSF